MSRILANNGHELQRLGLRDLESLTVDQKGLFETLDPIQTAGIQKGESGPDQCEPGPSPGSKDKAEPKSGPDLQPEFDLQAERQQAFEAGLDQGRDEERQRFDAAVKAFSAAARQIDSLRKEFMDRQKEDLIHLALVIARQIVGALVKENEQVILDVVEEALDSAVAADAHQVRVHPEDLEVVQAHKPLFLANIHGLKDLSIEADKDISRGGCVVDSNMGEVDATVETKLAAIKDKLFDSIQR